MRQLTGDAAIISKTLEKIELAIRRAAESNRCSWQESGLLKRLADEIAQIEKDLR